MRSRGDLTRYFCRFEVITTVSFAYHASHDVRCLLFRDPSASESHVLLARCSSSSSSSRSYSFFYSVGLVWLQLSSRPVAMWVMFGKPYHVISLRHTSCRVKITTNDC